MVKKTYEVKFNFPKYTIPVIFLACIVLKITGLLTVSWLMVFIIPILVIIGISIIALISLAIMVIKDNK